MLEKAIAENISHKSRATYDERHSLWGKHKKSRRSKIFDYCFYGFVSSILRFGQHKRLLILLLFWASPARDHLGHLDHHLRHALNDPGHGLGHVPTCGLGQRARVDVPGPGGQEDLLAAVAMAELLAAVAVP